MSRYTPPGTSHQPERGASRRPRWVRVGTWVLLVGVAALILVDVAAFLVG